MAQVMKDIVSWLKQWFYTESEVDTITGGLQSQINNKADSTTVSSLTTTVGTKADKTGGVQQITDTNAHTNLGTSANASQGAINTAIDSVIGSLSNIKAIQIVSSLPTANADTTGKLYIVSENSKINVYYTEQSGSSYSWHKMDADILDELTISWNDIQNKPSTFTPSAHNHDDRYYTETEVDGLLDDKLDASDYVIDSALSSSSTNPLQNKVINTALNLKSAKSETIDIDNIELVNKGETNEGCIIFYTIS